MRDGNIPNYLPSIKKMCELLEIPGDETNDLFLLAQNEDDNDNKNDNEDIDDESDEDGADNEDGTAEKEQKIEDRNKDAKNKTRKTRPTKEKTDRDRI